MDIDLGAIIVAIVSTVGSISALLITARNSARSQKAQEEAQRAATQMEQRKINKDAFETIMAEYRLQLQELSKKVSDLSQLLRIALFYSKALRDAVRDNKPLPVVPSELSSLADWYGPYTPLKENDE